MKKEGMVSEKSPEVDVCLVCTRNSKKANVAKPK